MSAATWSAYSKVWKKWQDLLARVGVKMVSMEYPAVLYLICLNFEQRVSVSAINRKLAGLVFLFKIWDVQDFTKTFLVWQALKGYRRGFRNRDSRRLVIFSILQDLWA